MIVFVHYTNPKEGFFFYQNHDKESDSDSDSDSEHDESVNKKRAEKNFRKKYCEDNTLKYKGQKVKSEMVQHVFPELNFNGAHCNPCDENCKYDFIEEEEQQDEQIHVSTIL